MKLNDRITREVATEMVRFVVDDALNGRPLGADPHAIVRKPDEGFTHPSRLVGWFSGPVVAVHSYLDVALTDDEAVELALDYLREHGACAAPDFVM